MRVNLSGFFDPQQIETLMRAFHGACKELDVDRLGFDLASREKLATAILRLAQRGELNTEALRRRAVIYYRNT